MRVSLVIVGAALALAACHSGSGAGDVVVNSSTDNTVGTASDEMTNIDAAQGISTNLAADVGNANAPSEPGLSDANTSDANDSVPAAPVAAKPKHHAAAKPAADSGNSADSGN